MNQRSWLCIVSRDDYNMCLHVFKMIYFSIAFPEQESECGARGVAALSTLLNGGRCNSSYYATCQLLSHIHMHMCIT